MSSYYTCALCGAISHNPEDSAQQYCGRCQRFTTDLTTAWSCAGLGLHRQRCSRPDTCSCPCHESQKREEKIRRIVGARLGDFAERYGQLPPRQRL